MYTIFLTTAITNFFEPMIFWVFTADGIITCQYVWSILQRPRIGKNNKHGHGLPSRYLEIPLVHHSKEGRGHALIRCALTHCNTYVDSTG